VRGPPPPPGPIVCSTLTAPPSPLPLLSTSLARSLSDDKLKDKISDDDKEKATKAVDDALAWLESNQLAEKEEFEHKQKEVEGICTPIMQSLYSQGGGGGMGGMPGGMVSRPPEPKFRFGHPRPFTPMPLLESSLTHARSRLSSLCSPAACPVDTAVRLEDPT
jgi:hypothetical protein